MWAWRISSPGLRPIANELTAMVERYTRRPGERAHMDECLRPVLEFRDAHDCEVDCGEFGAIAQAPDEDRRRWYADLLGRFDDEAIGWSCWSYKGMGFGVVSREGEVNDPHLLEILRP